MFKSFTMELAGRPLTVEVGKVAKQANGAAFMKYGDTTVLSTATASDKPRDGIDFFPLSVEFEEKLYSVGKIPGGFNKREGKASENAILTSRVIDRPMRPLFPKDYRNDVTLNNMVMSVDPACRPEIVAMLGAAIATCISDIPFDGPCAMTQVGMIDGEFIINPSQEQWKKGDLNLTVASTREKVIMIEAGANEVPEAKMIDAIYTAHDVNQTIIKFIDEIVAEVEAELKDYIKANFKVGDRLPAHQELSEILKVSIKTVHDAMKNLIEEGYLLARRGRYGTTVIKLPYENLLQPQNEISIKKATIFASARDAAFYSYQKIENIIKNYIKDNFEIGDKLPSMESLSEHFDVSSNTIRKALQNLSKQGYVNFSRGRYGGTFVMDIPEDETESAETFRWLAVSPNYTITYDNEN